MLGVPAPGALLQGVSQGSPVTAPRAEGQAADPSRRGLREAGQQGSREEEPEARGWWHQPHCPPGSRGSPGEAGARPTRGENLGGQETGYTAGCGADPVQGHTRQGHARLWWGLWDSHGEYANGSPKDRSKGKSPGRQREGEAGGGPKGMSGIETNRGASGGPIRSQGAQERA